MTYFYSLTLKRWGLWTLGVLLVSLFVWVLKNFLAFRAEKVGKVLTPNIVALQSIKPKHWPEAQAEGKENTKVILFGDSRIEEWRSEWPQRLSVLNQGISGSTTSESLQRFQQDVIALKPNWVVLQIGINDVVASRLVGAKTRKIIEDRVIENTLTLIRECLNHNIRIIYFSILPAIEPDGLRALVWQGDLSQPVARVNQGIKAGINQLRQEAGNAGYNDPLLEGRLLENRLFELDTEWLLEQFQTASLQTVQPPVSTQSLPSAQQQWNRDALHWTPAAYQKLQQQVVNILK